MKAKWGALVVEGRGKLGGQVASRNRAGAYFRNKVSPVNPSTAYQSTVRARLSNLSQGWRDLPQTERDAWNAAVGDFARTDVFGDLRNPTGFNLYQRLNNNLVTVGQPVISVPPLPSEVLTVTIGSLTLTDAGPATAQLSLSGAVPANTSMELWATPGQSAGKSFVKSEYRLLQVFAAASASPANFLAAYNARFGALVLGTKVFVQIKFVNQTTGQASQFQSTSALVEEN